MLCINIISHKVLLPVHLHKPLHNKAATVSPMSAQLEYNRLFEIICMYVYTFTQLCQTHQDIRSFKFMLLASRAESEFEHDTTHF